MDKKKWLKLLAQIALVVSLLYCLCNINRQKKIIDDLKLEVATQIEAVDKQIGAVEGLVGVMEGMSILCAEQSTVDEFLMSEVTRLAKEVNKLNGIEPVAPVDITGVENRVDSILSQIEQLEKDKLTQADFDKWVQDLEKLVNNSLVELSKPPTVPPVNPMPNVEAKPPKVALSNQEKAEIVKMIKKEIFKQFADAGYGKFEGDKFIMKEGFFGARIDPDDLHRYEPVSLSE